MPPSGTADVRGTFIDVGRLTPTDPRLSRYDHKPDPDHWPMPGELLILSVTSADPVVPEPSTTPSLRTLAIEPWRFDGLPIGLATIPVGYGTNRSGQSHESKIAAIRQALTGVERVIIATDPGREGSMIAWEVLEHLGWHGRVDRLKLGALDEVSIRRAFAALAKDPDSGERDYAAYLEALCRQYEDYHLGLNGTRAISLRLRPPAFREPWRFGGVQTPTLAILADLEERIRSFVPQDFFKVAVHLATRSGAELTLWHAPKERIFDPTIAETIRSAAAPIRSLSAKV